jgi:hypothetical protein
MKPLSKREKKKMDIEWINAFMKDMSFDQIEALTNAASEIFSDEKYLKKKKTNPELFVDNIIKNEKSF